MRSAGALLSAVNRLTSHGDVITVTSLQGVCRLWHGVLIHRRWNQLHLRRSLDGRIDKQVENAWQSLAYSPPGPANSPSSEQS